jgi:hypothetical protein
MKGVLTMAKNCFANKMFQQKEKAYRDGVWDGLQLGLNLVAIALNHTFGFGNERLTRLEAKVQELVNEMVDAGDPLVNKAHIEKAVRQIRKAGWQE